MRWKQASHAFLLLCSMTTRNYVMRVLRASFRRAQAPKKTRKECTMLKYFSLMDRFFVSAVAITGVWYVGALSQMI
jgi:hypothetical protein